MSKAALACLFLLFCLGQSGCDRPSLAIPHDQPTHDANGYLIQPGNDFLVGGWGHVWKHLFIQISVDGSDETRPFILTVGNEILPHDNWPLAPEIKPSKQSDSGFFISKIEDPPPRALGGASLNSEELAMLAQAVRKYFVWSDTAAKESLNVEAKELLSLTNKELTITFSSPKETSKSFIEVSVSTHNESFPFSCSITLDKMGVDRLLSVITNLPDRRTKFITFSDNQHKIAFQRREAQQKERAREKARADELLH